MDRHGGHPGVDRMIPLGNGLANNAMNLTVRPVTRLANQPAHNCSKADGQGARPSRPAGYRGR